MSNKRDLEKMKKDIQTKMREIYDKWYNGETYTEEEIDFIFKLDHNMGAKKNIEIRRLVRYLDLAKYIDKFIEERDGKKVLDLSYINFEDGLDLFAIIYGIDGFLETHIDENGEFLEGVDIFDDIDVLVLSNCEIRDRLSTIGKTIILSNAKLTSESDEGFECSFDCELDELRLDGIEINASSINFSLVSAKLIDMSYLDYEGFIRFNYLKRVGILNAYGSYIFSEDYFECEPELDLSNLEEYEYLDFTDAAISELFLNDVVDASRINLSNARLKKLVLSDLVNPNSVNLQTVSRCDTIVPDELDYLNVNKPKSY